MNRFFLLLLLVGSIAACQPKSSSSGDGGDADNETTPAANGTSQTATSAVSYPSIPFDTLSMLWEKCDYVDFVFYNLNFSMSQNEKVGIQSTLRHIAEDVPVINENCAPVGRIFFQVDGRNALEGDFFIGENCLYYIFYENGKKTYANSMTEMGKNFFSNIFSQMMKSQEQTQ